MFILGGMDDLTAGSVIGVNGINGRRFDDALVNGRRGDMSATRNAQGELERTLLGGTISIGLVVPSDSGSDHVVDGQVKFVIRGGLVERICAKRNVWLG